MPRRAKAEHPPGFSRLIVDFIPSTDYHECQIVIRLQQGFSNLHEYFDERFHLPLHEGNTTLLSVLVGERLSHIADIINIAAASTDVAEQRQLDVGGRDG